MTPREKIFTDEMRAIEDITRGAKNDMARLVNVKAGYALNAAAKIKDGPSKENRGKLWEELARLCHDQWSGWMQYLFSKIKDNNNGTYTIPPGYSEKWRRQMFSDYADLSKEEQDSDRKEADRFLALLSKLKQYME